MATHTIIQNIFKNIERFSSQQSCDKTQEAMEIDEKEFKVDLFYPPNKQDFPIYIEGAKYKVKVSEGNYSIIALVSYDITCSPNIVSRMWNKVWLDDRIFDGDVTQVISRFIEWLHSIERS